MSPYECIICGSREHVLREGRLQLCTRCLEALGQALGGKLPCMEGQLADVTPRGAKEPPPRATAV